MNHLKKSIMGKYNAEDVDQLLSKVRNDYEACLKEQKDRIITLREQNRELSEIVAKYKNDERYIIGAIKRAEETAQFIIDEAQQKAKERIEDAQNEERQVKMTVEGCYQRLYGLRSASEAIFRAVAKAMGECEPSAESNVRLIKGILQNR